MTKELHYDGPIVLVILDGVGLSAARSGNAVRQAHTEFLDEIMLKYLNIPLNASGEAVGVMPGQMGNSEVGHNAIGAGQIIQQGIAGVETAFATGAVWDSKAWRGMLKFLRSPEIKKPLAAEKSKTSQTNSDKTAQANANGADQTEANKTSQANSDKTTTSSTTVAEQVKNTVVDVSQQLVMGSAKISEAAVDVAKFLDEKADAIAGREENKAKINQGAKTATTATSDTISRLPNLTKKIVSVAKKWDKEAKYNAAIVEEMRKDERTAATAEATKNTTQTIKRKGEPTLHFAGIFSDGGVHSDIKYLEQMIAHAYEDGIRRMRIHVIFDGRDVAPQSEPKYIERLEKFCAKFKDADIKIATGAGRMVATADRYENDWSMVKLGWDMMVDGRAPRNFASATEAIEILRRENPKVQDQYLPAFVVVGESGKPVGRVNDGDAFIYYDFRADRALEISRAFTEDGFDKFKRNRVPAVYFASMTEYDSDKHIPAHTLVPPVQIDTTLNRFLGQHKLSQLAISETVKFGHVTYYFNGNSYRKAPREEQIEIPSDQVPFNQRPWMKSAEITDLAIEKMAKFDFVRLNYPGGDMVGHFAELEPTIIALEAIDLQLQRLAQKVDELGGVMIVTADHGNAEELLDKKGVPKTSHTTNPVPCIFYDNTPNAKKYRKANLKEPGLANLAATIATLIGEPDYPAPWQKPLITVK